MMYEFVVYHRGTRLVAGPSIWARCQAEAERILFKQEGFTSRAFYVEQAWPEGRIFLPKGPISFIV
jgi:hypothetical protein